MKAFQYEEQGEKKYLVYQKRDSEDLDTFTTEMLSNNRIPGLVPFSYIQMDQSISMKYNIAGLVSLETYLENTVKKGQFLKILESLCDAVMQADDYILFQLCDLIGIQIRPGIECRRHLQIIGQCRDLTVEQHILSRKSSGIYIL